MRPTENELSAVIADDDSATRHALRLLLRENGCARIWEANDGERAVELCARHLPDLAFIDINMPKLDGHEAVRRIRDSNPTVGTIMITALPTLDNVQKALDAGVSGFVVKPFNAIKVAEAIRHCVRSPKQ